MSQTYNIPSYQTIYDALITNNVPLDSIVEVLSQSGYDLDTDFSETKGVMVYEEDQIVLPKGGQRATVATPTTSTYTTNAAQNLFDVCLMTVGDLNKFILLVSSNDFDSINDYPDGAITVNYNNSDITDTAFKQALKRGAIEITTGIVSEPVLNGILLQEDYFELLQQDGYQIEL